MKPIVYHRRKLLADGELDALKTCFRSTETRLTISSGDFVIPRFTVLPEVHEFYSDMLLIGAQTANTRLQHFYLADIGSWYPDLHDVTPQTWSSLSDVPTKDRSRPLILKGATNSRKDLWTTHMFAKDWGAAVNVYSRLSEDSFVGAQPLCVRRFVPFKRLGTTLTGCPIVHEFRFFVFQGQVVASGFYWAEFSDDVIEQGSKIPSPECVPQKFLDRVIDIVAQRADFFVMDVAQDDSDRWWVVELNDGQQSGLNGIDPRMLYDGLARICETHRER